MYVCVMDRQGKKLVHTNVKDNDFAFFLKLVQPYKHNLTVCCECMFGWYWLADACQEAGLSFVLAHALYVTAYKKQSRNSPSEGAGAKLQGFAHGNFFSFTSPGLIGVRPPLSPIVCYNNIQA
jgi:hypothetical protein